MTCSLATYTTDSAIVSSSVRHESTTDSGIGRSIEEVFFKILKHGFEYTVLPVLIDAERISKMDKMALSGG